MPKQAFRTPPLIGVIGTLALAGCWAGPVDLPPASMRVLIDGKSAAGPKPQPGAGAAIAIDATSVLHAASPYTSGYNRNHNQHEFTTSGGDRAALVSATRALVPRWGQHYLDRLAADGYPAPSAPAPIYRTGHGPTDGRLDFSYMLGYFFQQMWGLDGQSSTWDGYPYDDLRYALTEASAMGATPLVTVNFGTDTPENAGAEAAFLNAESSALRTAHPFTEPPFSGGSNAPRRVFLFEIGNEVQFSQMRGHDKANSIDEYVANAAPYVAAIRQASPHRVKVGLSAAVNVYFGGPTSNGDAWLQQGAMVSGFVSAAQAHGVTFEALVCHLYPSWPVKEQLAGIAYSEAKFRSTLIPAMGSASFEFWNDEFNVASGSGVRNPGMYGALYAADATVMAFSLSHGGRQLIPVGVDFGWWHAGANNGYDSLYFQDNSATHTTPTYHFRRLLASHWGDEILATHLTGVGAWTDTASDGTVTSVSNLHAVAARSADGRQVHVLVVNRSRKDETAGLNLTGFTPRQVVMSRLSPRTSDPWAAAWNEVDVVEGKAVKLGATVKFPAGTITILSFS